MEPQHIEILEKIHQGIIENNFMLKHLLPIGDMYLDSEFIAQYPI